MDAGLAVQNDAIFIQSDARITVSSSCTSLSTSCYIFSKDHDRQEFVDHIHAMGTFERPESSWFYNEDQVPVGDDTHRST